MGRVTSSVGLVSGIDSKAIIDQLIALESQSKKKLETRVSTTNNQKKAYDTLLTAVKGIRDQSLSLQRPSTFNAASATSSNDSVLSATASNGATLGSYQFRVARLVTAQQSVSTGFSDFKTQRVGAGNLTVEMGGGEVNTQTLLADLNGGAGVSRGTFRITDRSGASTVIDASAAVTLDDVVRKINSSTDIRVKATIDGDRLKLTDGTGSSSQNLIVQDQGNTTTAAGLGIATTAAGIASGTLTGTDINSISTTTALAKLNDGLGIRKASANADDITLTTRDGNTYSVNLANAKTVGDIVNEFDSATGGKVKLTINADGDGLKATDTTAGGGTFSIAAANGSNAAADLGLVGSGGSAIDGKPILGGLNTVLLKTLNGGTGLELGQLKITDRSGTAATIDLGGIKTLQGVLDKINSTTASGFAVKATVKDSGNGIQITDASGGTGDLIIEDTTLSTATALGLNGTFNNTTPTAVGKNLQRQWVNENSLLAGLNGGKGVTPGIMKFTSSSGNVAAVDLSIAGYTTLGQVMKAINDKTAAIGITAGLNANGDGLLLTDSAGGANKLKVEDQSGTMAANLNIRGQASATTIDGSYEKTIAITATDTLTEVTKKFTELAYGLSANVINDGSGASPYRLSLTAFNSGMNGRVVFDAGTTNLGTRKIVDAQDAAVFVGGSANTEPLLVTGSSNQLSGVLPGVNIDLHSASDSVVSLNVTRSADSLVETVQKYVDGFNEIVAGIDVLTKFDTETNTRGLLMGDSSVQGVETAIYASMNQVVTGAGQFRTLADVGITIGEGAALEFDEDKFRKAYADDATGVEKLFTAVDRTTVTKTTTGGILTNGVGADGTVINYVVTGGTTTTTTSINGPVVPNGTTYDGGTPTTVGGVTTVTGATIFQNTTTTVGRGFGYLIEGALTRLTDPVSGLITQTNKNLDSKIEGFKSRIESLDKMLEQKRARLQKQFADMESVLSKMQGQQQAINSYQPISYAPATS
ncbi:MAG TPA: flagellar filament capping protein FliD [Tepidisphaeraceae bacterium]|jgi:flagellar hook-associated protein 2|nr:flagellar filament capping protein FliD [Tepidisphaeraceae bacterium]